jgi:hypothetical protein
MGASGPDDMRRSKAFSFIGACLVFIGLQNGGRAANLTWKGDIYHDAAITSVDGDHVAITGKRDSDGVTETFRMPLSNVPDEIIQAYGATHDPAGHVVAERPLTAAEEANMKAERAERKAKLANLKDALSKDPYHPKIVAGHIVAKSDKGVVITCDAATPEDLPQSAGTVFLKDCPRAQKLNLGDPIAAVGYDAGDYVYELQNLKAYSIRPMVRPKPSETPAPSTGSTPASSP